MSAGALSTIEANGLTLAYEDLGSGPPVLLLHGWPTSSCLWRDHFLEAIRVDEVAMRSASTTSAARSDSIGRSTVPTG